MDTHPFSQVYKENIRQTGTVKHDRHTAPTHFAQSLFLLCRPPFVLKLTLSSMRSLLQAVGGVIGRGLKEG